MYPKVLQNLRLAKWTWCSIPNVFTALLILEDIYLLYILSRIFFLTQALLTSWGSDTDLKYTVYRLCWVKSCIAFAMLHVEWRGCRANVEDCCEYEVCPLERRPVCCAWRLLPIQQTPKPFTSCAVCLLAVNWPEISVIACVNVNTSDD